MIVWLKGKATHIMLAIFVHDPVLPTNKALTESNPSRLSWRINDMDLAEILSEFNTSQTQGNTEDLTAGKSRNIWR